MTWTAAAQTHLRARDSFAPRWMLWIEARERGTGAAAATGLWQGDDEQTFTIDGQSRLYHGAQDALMPAPIRYRTGTIVQSQDVTISGLTAEAQQLVRGYDTRFCPAELHLALLNPQSMEVIDVERMFRGTVDRLSVPTPEANGSSSITVTLVSQMRAMTQTLALKKSDESQKRRENDRFRRYGAVAERVTVPWGAKREGAKRDFPFGVS